MINTDRLIKRCIHAAIFILLVFPVQGQSLSNTQITAITTEIGKLILSHYVVREEREKIVDLFQAKVDSGKYLLLHEPDSLARVLSDDLSAISKDKHLYVRHLNNDPTGGNDHPDWEKEESEREQRLNFGFREVEILDLNIGYLKIVEFMHPQRAMQTAVAAMKLVENTAALIIDIRGNRGGYPGIMEYILNHYFEGAPLLLSTTYFSDKTIHPVTRYTSDLVYGKLRVGTPLYILIDETTGSAAEYFAYTLQAHKKAKIIGTVSSGGANMNTFFPLPHHFRMSISTAMPIIEATKSNWEHTGVIPDYKVKSEDAKAKAIDLILADK